MRALGVETIIYTDIAKDGTLSGTNLEAYRALVQISGLRVVASGGISSLEDIRQLKEMGVDGAILGKALYDGMLELEEVLQEAEDGIC